MKYANIIYDGNRTGSVNLGDDIQLLAIQHIYEYMGIPEKDIVRISLSELSTYDGEYVILPISFPLYGYRKDLYITMFSPKIIPIFLALSIMSNNISEEEQIYLRRFEPIGCRDIYTMNLLREKNILAYMGGCMTATFPKKEQPTRDKVYIVDIPEGDLKYIPDDIKKEAIFTSQIKYDCKNPELEAKEYLDNYAKTAKLVITSRLHCALPCTAMGIPAILMKDKYSFRFPTVSKYIPIYTKEKYNQINWSPDSIDYESDKKKILDFVSNRLKDAYSKYSPMYDISSFYENNNSIGTFYIEHYDNIVELINKTYSQNDAFEYAVWGITQKADMICSYIEKNFPRAIFVTAYDRSRKVLFHGLQTSQNENDLLAPDTVVFVCTAAAMDPAIKLFSAHNKSNYYLSMDGIEKINN